jgi:hypothetical protein
VIKTDTCCPNTEIKFDANISIASAPMPIILSRDDESLMNDDEYEEVKNANDTPTQCPAIDDISYSTLGSPIDATPITPRPIPDEVEFHQTSCLRKSQYASIQRDNTFPPILNEQRAPTKAYIANSFEPIPLDVISEVPSYDTFTNIDSFLTQYGYADLVGLPLSRTPSEKEHRRGKIFRDIRNAYGCR